LQEKTPGLHYIPTLSRETWPDRTGYVHHIYEELCRDRQPAHFFLCGWHNMMEDAKKTIASLGYDKHVIHQEFFLTEEEAN
jgi:CDP-4-dehydro-6-deoxyglucose reductase